MANKKKFDAVYSGEKYTDRDGNEKTRYQNIGVVFENDKGQLSMKLESIPVGFSGWINFYEPKEQDNAKQASRAGQAANQARGQDDDPLPF